MSFSSVRGREETGIGIGDRGCLGPSILRFIFDEGKGKNKTEKERERETERERGRERGKWKWKKERKNGYAVDGVE